MVLHVISTNSLPRYFALLSMRLRKTVNKHNNNNSNGKKFTVIFMALPNKKKPKAAVKVVRAEAYAEALIKQPAASSQCTTTSTTTMAEHKSLLPTANYCSSANCAVRPCHSFAHALTCHTLAPHTLVNFLAHLDPNFRRSMLEACWNTLTGWLPDWLVGWLVG